MVLRRDRRLHRRADELDGVVVLEAIPRGACLLQQLRDGRRIRVERLWWIHATRISRRPARYERFLVAFFWVALFAAAFFGACFAAFLGACFFGAFFAAGFGDGFFDGVFAGAFAALARVG